MTECDRCGQEIPRYGQYPLDSVYIGVVGECCLKDTDEVVDL